MEDRRAQTCQTPCPTFLAHVENYKEDKRRDSEMRVEIFNRLRSAEILAAEILSEIKDSKELAKIDRLKVEEMHVIYQQAMGIKWLLLTIGTLIGFAAAASELIDIFKK